MKIIESTGAIDAQIRIPSSKSYTVRALLLAAMTEGRTTLHDCLDCDDSRYMLEALRKIGFEVDGNLTGDVTIGERRSMSAADVELYIGNAGTAMRFLTGALCFTPGRFILRGEERMHQRPIGDLVDALRAVDAEIEYLESEGYPPLQIRGKKVRGGFEVVVDGSVSSQFASSLMLAAANIPQGIDIRVPALASRPYLEITKDILREFGAGVDELGRDSFRVTSRRLERAEYTVEADWSSASYWMAAALVTGGRVAMSGLRRDSAQGDRAFAELLPRLGGSAAWDGDRLVVQGGTSLRGGVFDMNDTPDVVPTLAAIAPLATEAIEITNVANLRVKESDRIAVLAAELRKLGASVEERPDGLLIQPGWNDAVATIDPHGDHRIAMSFAIAGLRRGNIRVADDRVVGKSYPGFWKALETVAATGR